MQKIVDFLLLLWSLLSLSLDAAILTLPSLEIHNPVLRVIDTDSSN